MADVIQVVAAAILAVIFWEIRGRIVLWYYGKQAKPDTRDVERVFTKGYIDGAAKPVRCSKCGNKVSSYWKYSDEDNWCALCDAQYED